MPLKQLLAVSYEDGRQPKENNGQGTAAIDMGEIHSITSFADARRFRPLPLAILRNSLSFP